VTNLHVDGHSGATTTVAWDPGPEKSIASYIVAYGPRTEPQRSRLLVAQPHAAVPRMAAGGVVSVKAVAANGLEGWDWATIRIEAR
jgi:hypothetical protein